MTKKPRVAKAKALPVYPHYSIWDVRPTQKGNYLRFHVRITEAPDRWHEYHGCLASYVRGQKRVVPPVGYNKYHVVECSQVHLDNLVAALSNVRGEDLFEQLESKSTWDIGDLEWSPRKQL